jgi:hypothetical protein
VHAAALDRIHFGLNNWVLRGAAGRALDIDVDAGLVDGGHLHAVDIALGAFPHIGILIGPRIADGWRRQRHRLVAACASAHGRMKQSTANFRLMVMLSPLL